MKTWNQALDALRSWRWRKEKTTIPPDQHLLDANRNLRDLLEDTSIPSSVRNALAPEFREIEYLAEKLQSEEIHIAVFGRVGSGKSSLCNALLGGQHFETSPLHGMTKSSQPAQWESLSSDHITLIDTPGIDELDGSEREELAFSAAKRADILIMVCEGDLTEIEYQALQTLAGRHKPLVLALNKADHFSTEELAQLLSQLTDRTEGLLSGSNIVAVSADPRPETIIRVSEDGSETASLRPGNADVSQLRDLIWEVLEREGKSLAALNAALFASELDTRIAQSIVAARREVAEKIIQRYCLAKGVAVAANPVPLADLAAAAGIDVAMVTHLGQIYGHTPSSREASRLLLSIAAQLAALMGAYWGVNLVSSALKGMSAGLSTLLTGAAQGGLAWYATLVTGKAAETWFARGKTWGPEGPRDTVQQILDGLDRDSIIAHAKEEIAQLANAPSSGKPAK